MIKYNGAKDLRMNEKSKKFAVIVVNDKSGRSKSAGVDKLRKTMLKSYAVRVYHITDTDGFSYVPCDLVAVFGGDGTLNSIVNMYADKNTPLVYIPSGTLNECSKNGEGRFEMKSLGKADGKYFAYVFAAGTFTPLGYSVDNRLKKKIKSLAYIIGTLKELRVFRIPATITADGTTRKNEYALIMALKSKQCFNLKFNRAYKKTGGLYLLTIAAPKHDKILGLIELFFPYFRAFFVGFSKEYSSKRMNFSKIEKATVTLEGDVAFCVDGEKRVLNKNVEITEQRVNTPITVISRRCFGKLK